MHSECGGASAAPTKAEVGRGRSGMGSEQEGIVATGAPFWTRLPARRLQFTLDLLVLVSSFLLAYALRFDLRVPQSVWSDVALQLPLVALLQFAALSWAGIYSFIWRYIGLREVLSFF